MVLFNIFEGFEMYIDADDAKLIETMDNLKGSGLDLINKMHEWEVFQFMEYIISFDVFVVCVFQLKCKKDAACDMLWCDSAINTVLRSYLFVELYISKLKYHIYIYINTLLPLYNNVNILLTINHILIYINKYLLSFV